MSTTITIPFIKGQEGTYEVDKTFLPTAETGESNLTLTPFEWNRFCDQVEAIFRPIHHVKDAKCCCFCPAITLFLLSGIILICMIPFVFGFIILYLTPMVLIMTPVLYVCAFHAAYSKVIENLEKYLEKKSEKREGVSFQVKSQRSPKWWPDLENDCIKCIVSDPTLKV